MIVLTLFAARRPFAASITAPQPADIPHGIDSPVGRISVLDGQVLLLGIGHTANTTIHLAEYMSGVRYRRKKYLRILKDGLPARLDYAEIDHCCQNFNLVDGWLDEEGLQRKGRVGNADARLARSRDILRVVIRQIRQNERLFSYIPQVLMNNVMKPGASI